MKALATLIKLADQRVTNQRARVSGFEKKARDLENAMEALKSDLRFEAVRAQGDSYLGSLYGRYAQGVEEQIDDLKKQHAQNEKTLLREQARLAELYQDQKVLEVYERNKKEQEQYKLDQADQKNLDEIAARMKLSSS